MQVSVEAALEDQDVALFSRLISQYGDTEKLWQYTNMAVDRARTTSSLRLWAKANYVNMVQSGVKRILELSTHVFPLRIPGDCWLLELIDTLSEQQIRDMLILHNAEGLSLLYFTGNTITKYHKKIIACREKLRPQIDEQTDPAYVEQQRRLGTISTEEMLKIAATWPSIEDVRRVFARITFSVGDLNRAIDLEDVHLVRFLIEEKRILEGSNDTKPIDILWYLSRNTHFVLERNNAKILEVARYLILEVIGSDFDFAEFCNRRLEYPTVKRFLLPLNLNLNDPRVKKLMSPIASTEKKSSVAVFLMSTVREEDLTRSSAQAEPDALNSVAWPDGKGVAVSIQVAGVKYCVDIGGDLLGTFSAHDLSEIITILIREKRFTDLRLILLNCREGGRFLTYEVAQVLCQLFTQEIKTNPALKSALLPRVFTRLCPRLVPLMTEEQRLEILKDPSTTVTEELVESLLPKNDVDNVGLSAECVRLLVLRSATESENAFDYLIRTASDHPDLIIQMCTEYVQDKTYGEKFRAALFDSFRFHRDLLPVLVGRISIEDQNALENRQLLALFDELILSSSPNVLGFGLMSLLSGLNPDGRSLRTKSAFLIKQLLAKPELHKRLFSGSERRLGDLRDLVLANLNSLKPLIDYMLQNPGHQQDLISLMGNSIHAFHSRPDIVLYLLERGVAPHQADVPKIMLSDVCKEALSTHAPNVAILYAAGANDRDCVIKILELHSKTDKLSLETLEMLLGLKGTWQSPELRISLIECYITKCFNEIYLASSDANRQMAVARKLIAMKSEILGHKIGPIGIVVALVNLIKADNRNEKLIDDLLEAFQLKTLFSSSGGGFFSDKYPVSRAIAYLRVTDYDPARFHSFTKSYETKKFIEAHRSGASPLPEFLLTELFNRRFEELISYIESAPEQGGSVFQP